MVLGFIRLPGSARIDHLNLRLCLIKTTLEICGKPKDFPLFSSKIFTHRTAEIQIDNFEVGGRTLSFQNGCYAFRGMLEYIENRQQYYEVIVKIYVGKFVLGAAKVTNENVVVSSDRTS